MKLRKKVVILLLTIFASFIFLELAAKILIRTYLKEKINQQFLRTEIEEIYVPPFPQKEPGEYRIFVYGGSTVQGTPLPKIGFVSQLQFQLNHVFETENVKVFNLGWAGFNSTRIRYLLEQTVDQKPDLVIVYTGENEFTYPQLDFYWLVRSVSAVKNRTSLGKLIMYATKYDGSRDNQEFFARDKRFPAYASNALLVFLKRKIFETNMEMITNIPRKSRVPLILGIPAHNIADWPPVRRELTTAQATQDYKEAFQKAQTLLNSDNIDEASSVIDHYLVKYPDDASLLFLKATAERRKGSQSKRIFEKAKDKDLVPWRTTTAHREYIKSLANEKNVWAIDFAQVLSESSKDRLVGFDLILDGTHPTKVGAYLISSQIIEFLKEKRLVSQKWIEEAKNHYEAEELFHKMGITKEDDFTVYLKTAQLSLKIPLMNLDGAKFYIKKAEDIDSQNWEIKATSAIAAHLEGDDNLAKSYLTQAEKLKKGKITEEEVRHIPYLSEILEK